MQDNTLNTLAELVLMDRAVTTKDLAEQTRQPWFNVARQCVALTRAGLARRVSPGVYAATPEGWELMGNEFMASCRS